MLLEIPVYSRSHVFGCLCSCMTWLPTHAWPTHTLPSCHLSLLSPHHPPPLPHPSISFPLLTMSQLCMHVRILRPWPETPDEQEVKTWSGVIITKDTQGKHRSYSIFSRIVTPLAESNSLKFAVLGGLIGVRTWIDPILCGQQIRWAAQVLGAVGKLPVVYI